MPKQARGDDFANAVTAAQYGYAYLPLELMREFVKSRKHLTRTGNIFGLSPREVEILEATISGMSTKNVAETLNISVRTVETHRNSIYKKTSCRDHKELAELIGVG
ncbi:helix-turn-helix transcriptional regulator [Yoonia sp. SS1-5]|uniref:Helix-turn-helix transcriptional regulator n=1 Tax=Yoonia rhodophyticola TaxID=3137370 RepID=A0ABZ3JD32_9RHOB